MSTADRFVAAARSYVGTRFVHQGRAPGAGLDCLGVVVCAAEAAGAPLRDVRTYRRAPDPRQLLAELDAQLDRVATSDARAGDVAAFWCDKPGRVRHVGVIFAHGERLGVVHALAFEREVREHGLAGQWAGRLAAVYRLRGAEA